MKILTFEIALCILALLLKALVILFLLLAMIFIPHRISPLK